jgi:cellulose synthase/poly-beta-1,6-N-acetylglucosamine synthase-like glycosyltransferase
VVIAFNEAANIRACLASVLAQQGAAVAQVVVVDDASTDGTDQIVAAMAQKDRRVELVRLDVNGGRGHARAVGTARATGDLVAMVDGDVVLPAHWLARCLEVMAGPSAVGGKAVPDGDATYIGRRFRLRPRGRASTMTITGNNGLYRREVFDAIGFDPQLVEGEDIAFNHAMRNAGLSAAPVPGLTVSHNESKTFWQSVRWLYQSGVGGARQLETYRQVRLPDVAFAGLVLAVGGAGQHALRRRQPAVLLVPLVWLGAVATGHMLACFRPSRADAGRFVLASAVDMVLIAAYNLGRATGHLSLRWGR